MPNLGIGSRGVDSGHSLPIELPLYYEAYRLVERYRKDIETRD